MSLLAPPRPSKPSSPTLGVPKAAVVGGGCLSALMVPGLLLLVAFACVLMAVGWIGQEAAGMGRWIEGLFGASAHPAVASTQSRPTQWLGELGAYRGSPAPSALMLALMEQTSGGAPLIERFWCGDGTISDGLCSKKAGGTMARSYGLFGLIPTNALSPPPSGAHSDDNVAWQAKVAELLMASDLHALEGDWSGAVADFFSQLTPQNPTHRWRGQNPYDVAAVKGAVEAYARAPVLGSWSTASWSSKTGAYIDNADAPEWVLATGAAPTGPTHLANWTPPVAIRNAKGKITGYQDDTLYYRHLITPTTVTGFERGGSAVNFTSTTVHATLLTTTIPAYPGALDFGAKVPLDGPKRLVTITATWPQASETIDFPSNQVVSIHQDTTVSHPVSMSGLTEKRIAQIEQAAASTGVPATWIAAEMLVESNGRNVCYNDEATQACGVMQLEPQTARDLPGYTPGARMDPAKALVLGAELLGGLHQALGSWHLAAAAYYGGLGAVEQAMAPYGIRWPTTWASSKSTLEMALDVVPDPGAGNHLTLLAYTQDVAATERRVHI